MTVLAACQSAMIRIVGQKPSTIFSLQNQMEVEFADLVTEAATAIAKQYDWQALTRFASVTGNATDTAFALPPDFDRMMQKGDIHSATWSLYRYLPARDLDQWLDFQTFPAAGVPGYWIVLGDKLQILPIVGSGDQAKFYYQTKNFVTAATGAAKSAFDKDDDAFVLSERLLTLALIWRWKAMKGREYAEDMRNYEIALSEEIGADKGPRVFAASRKPRYSLDTRLAYPGPLG